MKFNKWIIEKVIQSNHGHGWDDVEYFSNSISEMKACKQALRDYRLNQPSASHRIIERRVLNPAFK